MYQLQLLLARLLGVDEVWNPSSVKILVLQSRFRQMQVFSRKSQRKQLQRTHAPRRQTAAALASVSSPPRSTFVR